jgi:hypothetical protein
VQMPRGMQRVVNADVAEKHEKTYFATYHDGIRLTRHRGRRGTTPHISQKRVGSVWSGPIGIPSSQVIAHAPTM